VGVGSERLAALLDGRLSRCARQEVFAALDESDEALEVLADSAAVLGELEAAAAESGELEVLRALRARSSDNVGWMRRCVRGWIFTDELRSFPLAVERLVSLAERGLVSREDVLDPGRNLPLYINRITQAGEVYLSVLESRDAVTIRRPRRLSAADAVTIYLPRSAWAALRVLAAVRDPEELVAGALVARQSGEKFFAEEREALERRKLIEVFRPATGGRHHPLMYRATRLGRGARARDTRSSTKRVQVTVPGIALRAPAEGRVGNREDSD
jgi:hypothetical protein